MPVVSRGGYVSTTKPNSARSIATHPCKKRKDGAPSVGIVHAKTVKGGSLGGIATRPCKKRKDGAPTVSIC